MWGPWNGGWWGVGMMLVWLVFLTLVVVGVVFIVRSFSEGGRTGRRPETNPALDILDQRFARGEIDQKEYEERRRILTAGDDGVRQRTLGIALVAIGLAGIGTAWAFGAMRGAQGWRFASRGPFTAGRGGPACTAPPLPGQRVDVTLSDMGGGRNSPVNEPGKERWGPCIPTGVG